MVDPKDCLWGREFFETYIEHAEKTSYFNEHLHRAAALSLIGQSLKNVFLVSDNTRTDCRIHPFVIQTSGSGKNGAFNFMGSVARKAGMAFEKEGTTSTAGIMGTVKRNGEVINGDLAGDGFLAWKEAQTLLKAANQTHSDDIIEVVNQALDPSGDVNKSLAGGNLEYSSRTSLFSTTYPPEPNGQIDLIHQGFLPRMLFIYEEVSDGTYDDINARRDRGTPNGDPLGPQNSYKYESDVEKLANTLNYIQEQVSKHGKVLDKHSDSFALTNKDIYYFESVEEGASMDTSYIYDEMKDQYSYRVQQEVKPFKTRMFDVTYKIAAAIAAVDYDEENEIYVSRRIMPRHTEMAHKVMRDSWRSIFEFVDTYMGYNDNLTLRGLENKVVNACQYGGGKVKINDIQKIVYKSTDEITTMLKTLEEMNKVQSNGTPFDAAGPEDYVKLGEAYKDAV